MKEYYKNKSGILYYGNALEVLNSLEDNSLDLIYIDPPFATGNNFYTKNGDFAFFDKYKIDELLDLLVPIIKEIYRVLKDTGSFYIHGDDNYIDYIKVECDKIFGIKNFKNNIVRIKTKGKNSSTKEFGDITDRILFYVKDKNKHKFFQQFKEKEYGEKELKSKYKDDKGYFYTAPLYGKGETKNGESGKPRDSKYGKILPPHGKHWGFCFEKMNRWEKEGKIYWTKNKTPRKKIYLGEKKYIRMNNIWDIKNGQTKCTYDYPTTKPELLLERIIKTSSQE